MNHSVGFLGFFLGPAPGGGELQALFATVP
jgi:hypothetical protein